MNRRDFLTALIGGTITSAAAAGAANAQFFEAPSEWEDRYERYRRYRYEREREREWERRRRYYRRRWRDDDDDDN